MKKSSKAQKQEALFGLFPGESTLSDSGNYNVLDNVTKKLEKSRKKLVEEIKKQEEKPQENKDLKQIEELLPKIKSTFKSLFSNLNAVVKLSEKSVAKLTKSYEKLKDSSSVSTKKKKVKSAESKPEPETMMLRPNIGPMSILNSVLPIKAKRKRLDKKIHR